MVKSPALEDAKLSLKKNMSETNTRTVSPVGEDPLQQLGDSLVERERLVMSKITGNEGVTSQELGTSFRDNVNQVVDANFERLGQGMLSSVSKS